MRLVNMDPPVDGENVELTTPFDYDPTRALILSREVRVDGREVFIEVVERGSFTEAARRLGISLSYASRRVKALEAELGTRLLARTTRRVQPTAAGQHYYERLAPLLRDLEALDREMADDRIEPRGLLRVAAPLAFGLRFVQPLITSFLCRWPEVRLEVGFSDRRVDPLDHDVTIRGGVLEDSSLTARRLVGFRGVLAASPAYLERRGTPRRVDDLDDHEAVVYTGTRSMGDVWTFGAVTVRPTVRLRADSGDALVAAAEAGLGVVYQPDFLMHHALQSGALLPILETVETWQGAFWAITHGRARTATVQAFVDHLAEGLRRDAS
jgi:DNA-binding transcriptional LysR family regulator